MSMDAGIAEGREYTEGRGGIKTLLEASEVSENTGKEGEKEERFYTHRYT